VTFQRRNRSVKKADLIKYCTDHSIFVPKPHSEVKMDYLYSAIYRMLLHKKKPEIQGKNSCYGYWEHENMDCETCDHGDKCFALSVGMERVEYETKLSKLENPLIQTRDKTYRKKR